MAQAGESVWVEGEKIPDDRVRDIFRQPPGVPTRFYRSALIIGSRGVGKTTLFRYQKEVHQGIAIHISLPTEFPSLTKETAIGPLTLECPPGIEELLIGKAISLLAVSISERLAKKDVVIPDEALLQCMPSDCVTQRNGISMLEWLARTKRCVAATRLERFAGVGDSSPLSNLLGALSDACEEVRGPLLLLLDRADMVPAPSLVPVLELLDQSNRYIALVAMRPGHAGQAIARVADSVVAGDHYAVEHLGTYPRSHEWSEFASEAVRAQIGDRFGRMPKELKQWILAISRDSLRTALELFARYLSVGATQGRDELVQALEDLRENQMAAAQRTLQRYHPDFRRLVTELRTAALEETGLTAIDRPLQLSIQTQAGLFSGMSRIDRFVDIGLRSGALCLPDGKRWVPGVRPGELEIPPILLWQKGDPFTPYSQKPLIVKKPEHEVLRRFAGVPKPPSVFVAYRIKNAESRKFRTQLEEAIHLHPELGQLRVVDGDVPAGSSWAEVIRGRIRQAKAVVGDLTGMRPDILFEAGFAYGLQRIVIPAVARPEDRAALPHWLGATQFGHYSDRLGLQGLVASVATHLSDPEFAKIPRAPLPIPALALWVRVLRWNQHAQEQFSTVAQREGLKAEVLGDEAPEETIMRRAASASLLIVSLDGTDADALMHFVCGAVVARPKAGSGTLQRRILILEEPSAALNGSLAGDSLTRCHDTVRRVSLNDVRQEVVGFAGSYTRWTARPPREVSKR
jgi:hypothetical protein